MSDWTARIDALLAERPSMNQPARLALAAERLREPHDLNCHIGGGRYCCTCGKDSDLARILEGK